MPLFYGAKHTAMALLNNEIKCVAEYQRQFAVCIAGDNTPVNYLFANGLCIFCVLAAAAYFARCIHAHLCEFTLLRSRENWAFKNNAQLELKFRSQIWTLNTEHEQELKTLQQQLTAAKQSSEFWDKKSKKWQK